MRLFRLVFDEDRIGMEGPQAPVVGAELELYVDAADGRVYALSPEHRDEVDPLWRERGSERA